MIAVDSSALVAIAFGEPEASVFSDVLVRRRAILGSPTLVETMIVLQRDLPGFADTFIRRLLTYSSLEVVAFSFGMYEIAASAFRSFGKGQGHPARLNFGDCMSYAVARAHDLPLLYKGDDFAHTDIEAAWRP